MLPKDKGAVMFKYETYFSLFSVPFASHPNSFLCCFHLGRPIGSIVTVGDMTITSSIPVRRRCKHKAIWATDMYYVWNKSRILIIHLLSTWLDGHGMKILDLSIARFLSVCTIVRRVLQIQSTETGYVYRPGGLALPPTYSS